MVKWKDKKKVTWKRSQMCIFHVPCGKRIAWLFFINHRLKNYVMNRDTRDIVKKSEL